MSEVKNALPSAGTAPPAGSASDLQPGTITVAVSLVVLGAIAGWYGRGGLGPEPPPPSAVALEAEDPVEAALPASTAGSQPDIFLITVGSLRADHLPIYGSKRMTAPWLTELSTRSQVFLAATATSSWSLPSVVSLMTGLLPSQHGVLDAPSVTGPSSVEVLGLPPATPTLAQRLKLAGYATYAVVANPLFVGETGLGRAFDRYLAIGQADGRGVQFAVERLAPEIRQSQGPVFVWVHYDDPHAPYRGDPVALRLWDPKHAQEPAASWARLPMSELACRKELAQPGEGLARLQAHYDSEIRTVDEQIQLLYGDLGIGDDDLVVITGDHGVAFRDHGAIGHRLDLYEETVRVPLVVSWPSVWPEPGRFRHRVSLVDLVPTLAELAGVPIQPQELPASSLLPLLEGSEWARPLAVGAELVRDDGQRRRAVYDLGHKLVVGGAGPELYHLREDPREQRNLAADKEGILRELQGKLMEPLGGLPATPAVRRTAKVAPPVAQQLRALDYPPPRCR